MSRNKGTFNFSANFEPLLKAPLDSRQVVNTYADLTDPSTWVDANGNVWLYNGAIVGVANDASTTRNGIYILLDAANYTVGSSWSIASSSGGGGTINGGENLLGGDASIFSDVMSGVLRFRTLKAGNGINLEPSGNTIIIDSSGAGLTYQSTLDPSLATPSTVGGYPAGTTVSSLLGDSFTDFVDNLLFPTVYPTFVAPSNTYTTNVSSLNLIGSSINITSTAGFNRGQILIGSTFQAYRSGVPASYIYTDPSNNTLLIDVSSASVSNIQTINGYAVKIGTQTFTSRVVYTAGPQPYDSKGNAYSSPLPSGVTGGLSSSTEGVYPLYATTSSITVYTQQSLVSMLTGNNVQISMVAESGGNKQTFDIPDAWTGSPTSRPLAGIGTYNTVSSSWDHQGGSQGASLSYWTTSAVSHSISGNLVNYTRYTYNGTDRSSILIRLEF